MDKDDLVLNKLYEYILFNKQVHIISIKPKYLQKYKMVIFLIILTLTIV